VIAESSGEDVGDKGEESVIKTVWPLGRRGDIASYRSSYNLFNRGSCDEGAGFERDSIAFQRKGEHKRGDVVQEV